MKLSFPAVPVSLFSIIPGVAGLAGGWRLAARIWGVPSWIAEAVALCAVTIWLVLLVLYAAKWLIMRAEALAEFRHPLLCCFVALVPVSTALIALLVRPYSPEVAAALAVIGIVGQLWFGVYRTGTFWSGGRDEATVTPVLYLTTVAGSFVSAIVLNDYGHVAWAAPFFGAGLLSWLAFESVILRRLFVLTEMPPSLRPTLGVQLAPPSVGCLAYLGLTSGPPDFFAQGLIGYAAFQALVLIRLLPWICRQSFTASYWAFSFGVSALPAAMMHFVERGAAGPIPAAAPYVFALANLVIAVLAIGTLRLLFLGKLLPPRIAPAALSPPPAPLPKS
jgi:tellurite resistance protein